MSATTAELSHVLPRDSRVGERGHLEVGGCDLVDLAREFGTPAYVVAEADLRAAARRFTTELRERHPDAQVVFAAKAFPCTAVLRVFAAKGLGCDVASGGELAMALRAGFSGERIVLHGNAKSAEELSAALDAEVGLIALDSRDDVERLRQLATAASRRPRVLLRVTPGVAGDTHAAISTGQADSKFGVALSEAPGVIDELRGDDRLEFAGLHVHVGSQLFELEPLREAVRAVASLGSGFPIYDLGGGLATAYTEAQHPPTPAEYVAALVDAAHAALDPGARLLIEPGRALVAGCGVTLYTVQTVKRNVSVWVGVDGGMSDNLRPMLYGAPYEAMLADRPLAAGTVRCHVAGKHCESGDVLVRDALLPDPVPGDVLLTPATGAYGHAMANNYNGVPRPPVIFCAGGRAEVVVRRETYDDLTARDAG